MAKEELSNWNFMGANKEIISDYSIYDAIEG